MIPLFKPYMPHNLPEINNILYSGALSYGKWGKEFEKVLGEYIGNNNILTTNSFNSAMLLLLSTLGLKSGDEIIASPMACLASNQPFATYGLKIIWADINPKNGSLCPDSVKQKITKNTKAIFHNHFCGYVGKVDEISQIAKEKGLFLIDDAIEAFGSEYKGNKVGDFFSDATVYSFQTVRLPNTIDGGAVSFRNKELYDRAVLLRDYGIDRRKFRDDLNEINPLCDITLAGYGCTISEINSYIGCLQMGEIDNLLSIQMENAEQWQNKLKEYTSAKPIELNSNTKPNNWVYGVLAENKRKFIQEYREKGYYASGVHLPNNYYSVFNNKEKLKGVEEFYSKFIALPCGWWFNR